MSFIRYRSHFHSYLWLSNNNAHFKVSPKSEISHSTVNQLNMFSFMLKHLFNRMFAPTALIFKELKNTDIRCFWQRAVLEVCQSRFSVAGGRRGIWFDQGKPKTPVRTAVMVVKMKKSCSDIACNSVQAQHLLGYIEPSGYRDSTGWRGQKIPCSSSQRIVH